MEQAELDRVREKFEQVARTRFAGAAIDQVKVLQYGDEPEIEPGELLVRLVLALPEGADPSDKDVRHQVIDSFEKAHLGAIEEVTEAFRGSAGGGALEIVVAGDAGPGQGNPVMKLKMGKRSLLGLGGDLTPVMARVGPEDLETLDTLIAVGIAGSRAEAVRWALARIRERPAYEQIRARSREIEDLKSQF
jgi:hypothetical protein